MDGYGLGVSHEGLFGDVLERFTDEDFHRAVNTVRPNLIRVESDEATYNLHVMLRFDLERAMIRGDLAVADLPGAWNDRSQERPRSRRTRRCEGCLQDVHWSMGSVGYFPTYTLGNLYSAQLWDALIVAIPDLDQQVQRGEFAALLGWLRDNIHAHGRRFPATELSERLPAIPSARNRCCATSKPSSAPSTTSSRGVEGKVDAHALGQWVTEARRLCKEHGRDSASTRTMIPKSVVLAGLVLELARDQARVNVERLGESKNVALRVGSGLRDAEQGLSRESRGPDPLQSGEVHRLHDTDDQRRSRS